MALRIFLPFVPLNIFHVISPEPSPARLKLVKLFHIKSFYYKLLSFNFNISCDIFK